MKRFLLGAVALGVLAASPVLSAKKREQPDDPNTLTHGMVQMSLRVGQTSQLEVFNAFGAPNITTVDGSGQEVWIYDRHATITSDSTGGFSIGIGVGGGDGGVGAVGGLGFGKKKSKTETSQRTMTLVIKFNNAKVVSDFRSRSSSF